MKKLGIFVLTPILIIIIALTAVYFMFRGEVKKQLIPETQKLLKDSTNLNISFSDFEFSFAKLLQLEPSIIIKDLKVEQALSAKELQASLYLTDLLQKRFKVKNFELENAVINLKQTQKGDFELVGLNKQKAKKAKNPKTETQTQSFIEELELKNVEISNSLINLKLLNVKDTIALNSFNLRLSDFKLDKENRLTTKINLNSKLFNSNSSSIALNGALGPIDKDFKSLPINADQRLKISVNNIPKSLLEQNLGELLRISDAVISQEAKIQGDLLATSSGVGKLKLDEVKLGKSDKDFLTVNTELPISFKLKNKFTPSLSLSTDSSTIKLKSKDNDSGELDFDADINMNLKSGFITGSSSGNIKGIDVKNLLDALTDLKNIVSGELFLENYNVSFAGSNPDYLFKSAKADAKVELKNGSIYILNTITKYKDLADQVLGGLGTTIKTEKLNGKFKTFKADLNLANKILKVNNIDIAAEEENLKINGAGEVKDLNWLVFDVNLDIPKLEPVPLSVRGTMASPQIYPNVKKISKKQGEQMLNSFLEYGLNALKKSEPASSSTTTAADASPSPAKKQSLGGFLKNTLKDNLKDSFLEKEAEPAEATTN